jgi:hypothetical protein
MALHIECPKSAWMDSSRPSVRFFPWSVISRPSGQRSAPVITAHEVVLAGPNFERGGAGVVHSRHAVLFAQRQDTHNASHRRVALDLVHAAAEGADLRSGFIGAVQQLLGAEGRFAGSVFVFYAMSAAGLAQVLAQ